MPEEGIVNVAPKFDEATEYSYLWNEDLIALFGASNLKKNLVKEDARRSIVRNYFPKYDTLIFYDHGSENGLWGGPEALDPVMIFDTSDTPNFKDTRIYTMACLSSKKFGLEAYKHGCKEYWGAVESIAFTLAEHHLFGEVFNLGVMLRFKYNKPIKEVLKAMEDKFNENIDKTNNIFTKALLRADRDMWRCWSDETPPDPDESDCTFRRLAVRLFGAKGWKIPSIKIILRRIYL